MEFLVLTLIGLAIAAPCGCIAYWLTQKGAKDRRSSQLAGWLVFAAGVAAIVAIIVPLWMGARPISKRIACINNLKQLALAQSMYGVDNDDYFPPAYKWADLGAPYVRGDVLHCPAAASPFSYAFNKNLSQAEQDNVESPADVILLFEADAASANASGGPALLLRKPREQHEGVNIAAVDGRAVRMLDQKWIPKILKPTDK